MSFKEGAKKIAGHFQTGVSYMIPLVTAAGLLTSIAVICGGQGVWNQTSNIWGNMRLLGQTGLGFIPVIIAAYVAFSIADRPGLAPAFIVGTVANAMGTGFLGGMLVGIMVGYACQWLKKIPMPVNLTAVKSLIVIPFIATLVVGFIMIYIVGSPIKAMTVGLTAWLKGMGGSNAVLLGALLGSMMAVDMGGPINKIAYAFGMAAFTSGGYAVSTAMLTAIGIPPLGMFVATLLGGRRLYSDAEIENGRSALIMGCVGITEGAIPFAVADPLRVIPSIIVGTATGCALTAAFGVVHKTAMSTIMAIPFVNNILLYILAVAIGIVVTALLANFLKRVTHHQPEEEA